MKSKRQNLGFNDLLNIPEARNLVERLEELIGETEPRLVEMREEYVRELEEQYGYKYELCTDINTNYKR